MELADDTTHTTDGMDAATVVRGLPVATIAYAVGAIAFGTVELHDHPERWAAWIGANALNVGLCCIAMGVRRRLSSATQARAFLVAMSLLVAGVLTTYAVLAQGSWRLLAVGLVIQLAGISLLIPLGVIGQAITAAGVTIIYASPLIAGVQADTPVRLQLVTLASAAAVTVLGAYMADYYRRELSAAREHARREAAVANTLIEIGQELNATLSRAEVLRRLAARAAAVAPIGSINLIDDANRLRIVEARGLPDDQARAARDLYLDLDSLPGAWALLNLPLIELPDVRAQTYLPPELLLQFGYGALLVAPMRRGTKVLGAVSFMYPEPRPPFSDRERQLARGLAEQAALALENARLYEEQQEAAEVATALLRVAERIGSTLDPHTVAHDLATLAYDLLRCDSTAVYRWEDGRWSLAAVVHPRFTRQTTAEYQQLAFNDSDFPFFRELRRSGFVEIADAEAQELAPRQFFTQWNIRSSLTVLLARGADPLGMIVAAHAQRTGSFSGRERRVLGGLAQLGVVALTNAQLAEQLRSANRVKSEFVATMSHELRTPLTAILGYSDMLRDETLGPLRSSQTDALGRIHARALDLLQLVQATLDLNRLEAGVPTVECTEISVDGLIENIRTQVPARWLKPDVQLRFEAEEPDLRLWSDNGKLQTVLRNLIHNALKFTASGEVQLRVRPFAPRASVVIEVRDTGCGIAPERRAEIFEMFVQGSDTPGHDGAGLGLYLCRRFVTLLGGSIDVDSTVGEGSTFRVELPVGGPLSTPAMP